MDARHRRPAGGDVGEQTLLPGARAAQTSASLLLDKSPNMSARRGFWKTFFNTTDCTLEAARAQAVVAVARESAEGLRAVDDRHFEKSDGIGAIFPPIINSIIALRCLGYDNDHPLTASQIRELEKLEIEEGDTLASRALLFARLGHGAGDQRDGRIGLARRSSRSFKSGGVDSGQRSQRGRRLESEEPRRASRADGTLNTRTSFIPDVDDTFQVLTCAQQGSFPDRARANVASAKRWIARFAWVLTMQNKDGGWASFDKDCDEQFLTQIPFADHNAMIDPSTCDITGRGLETFSALGFKRDHPVVQKALAFLAKEQERDGTWFGRWGCNYIYGTWLALHGLNRIGEDMMEAAVSGGGLLAALDSKRRWRMGRIAEKLRRSRDQRAGREHAFADRVGVDGA